MFLSMMHRKEIPHPSISSKPLLNSLFNMYIISRFIDLMGKIHRNRRRSLHHISQPSVFRHKKTHPFRCVIWWTVLDLNQRPLRCQRSALPTELTLRTISVAISIPSFNENGKRILRSKLFRRRLRRKALHLPHGIHVAGVIHNKRRRHAGIQVVFKFVF